MKKKSVKCIIFFVISALFVNTFIFTSCESTSELIFSGKDYTEELIEEEEDYLRTTITYPKFLNNPDLNKIVKNTVISNWNNFKDYAEENWFAIKDLNKSALVPPFEYIVDYDVTYSQDIVSVYLNTYKFAGGAHGETSILTYNYDKKSKKLLNITDATGYSYEELSDICNKSLYKQYIADSKYDLTQESVEILDEMRREGTAPYAGNFQNFILDGNKVKVFFEPYTVAPYYYGILEVEFYKK